MYMLQNIYLLFNIGGGELLIVLLLILLLFGSKKIPEFARGLGKGIRQFREATNNIQRDINSSMNEIKNDIDFRKEIKNSDGKESENGDKKSTKTSVED